MDHLGSKAPCAANCLHVSSFNCRSLKSSLMEVKELCKLSHFVFLQEHWLLPCDTPMLNNIDVEYIGTGRSAVDISADILLGRPYGGTAILYHKNLSPYIQVLETHDPRLTAEKQRDSRKSLEYRDRLTVVHRPGKIMAKSGIKQVGKITSGGNSNVCCKCCRNLCANTDNGSIDGDVFLKWLKH